MKPYTRREMKRTETYNAIFKAAQTLFYKHGYNETTLGDIAREAGVAQRTIFLYFPAKEAIIFYEDQRVIDRLVQAIGQRNHQTVFQAARSFLTDNEHDPALGGASAKLRKQKAALLAGNPSLEEYFSSMLAHLEQSLAAAIADEYGLATDSLSAQLIAAACRTAIYHEFQIDDPAGRDDRLALVTKFIESGIKATT